MTTSEGRNELAPGDEAPAEVPAEAYAGAPDSALRRGRSLVGLAASQLGPRASAAVSGLLLTLLVESRCRTALAVTFALTSGRLVSWIVLPVLGRLSDRSSTRLGRRTPYMGVGLVVMGVCTFLYTSFSGYWPLVALIVIARQAGNSFNLTTVAVVPETVGRSRWVRALILIGIGGFVVSLVVKGTAVMTWQQKVPSTWTTSFRLAGILIAVAGVIVLLLVREAPAVATVAQADRLRRGALWTTAAQVMRQPNAWVLVSGVLLFWAGIGATANLGVVYFQKVLGAGGSTQVLLGYVTGIPSLVIGLPLGYVLARVFTRKQIAIAAPAIGGVLFGALYGAHHIWQAVVYGFVGSPLIAAYVIVLAAFFVQLLPRSGGLGERLGTLVAPFSMVAVAGGYGAALAVDAAGNDYRVIWIFPAVAGIAHALVMCFLRVPAHHRRVDFARSRAIGRSLFRDQFSGGVGDLVSGEVSAEEADGAQMFDRIREVFGDPYAEPDGRADPVLRADPCAEADGALDHAQDHAQDHALDHLQDREPEASG